MIESGAPDLHPDARLIVGIENDPPGSGAPTVRIYLGARSTGVHTHVADPDAIRELQQAWAQGGHVTTRVPKPALCVCDCSPRQKAIFYGLEN